MDINQEKYNVASKNTIPSNANLFARKKEVVVIIFVMNLAVPIATLQFLQIILVISTVLKCSTVENMNVENHVI